MITYAILAIVFTAFGFFIASLMRIGKESDELLDKIHDDHQAKNN